MPVYQSVKVLRDVAQYGVEVETGLIAFVDAASSGTSISLRFQVTF